MPVKFENLKYPEMTGVQ